jgi:hypothetical protein
MKSLLFGNFKTFFGGLMLLLFSTQLQAQKTPASILETIECQRALEYTFADAFAGQILLSIPFGKSQIVNAPHVELLKEVVPMRVELLYSVHPEAGKCQKNQQRNLNLQRLESLYALAPELFNNPQIEWRIVAQDLDQIQTPARDLFHGFVIYYRNKNTGKKK